MGMFDYVYYRGDVYQSKDTPAQYMDTYKIEEDQETGRMFLWHKDGKVYKHCHDFDGLIYFCRYPRKDEWIEYKALFMNGVALKLERVK